MCACAPVRAHVFQEGISTEWTIGAKIWNLEETVLRHAENFRKANGVFMRWFGERDGLFGALPAQLESLDFIPQGQRRLKAWERLDQISVLGR